MVSVVSCPVVLMLSVSVCLVSCLSESVVGTTNSSQTKSPRLQISQLTVIRCCQSSYTKAMDIIRDMQSDFEKRTGLSDFILNSQCLGTYQQTLRKQEENFRCLTQNHQDNSSLSIQRMQVDRLLA